MRERRLGDGGRTVPTSVALLCFSALVSGCAAGAPLRTTISAQPSTVLQLSWAKAKRTGDGITVWGQVQQVHCCRYLRGHIHVEARDQNGTSLAATNAPWGEFNPRQIHSAWFKAVLPVRPGNRIASIDIQFITGPQK